MHDPHREAWYPGAAYFYALHLDGPALAWEYLRRHPDYRRDWRRHRGSRVSAFAQRWGLHWLEDPGLDAREAHPVWCPTPPGLLQFHPDLAPAADAAPFDVWCVAGHKHLFHDGQRLMLTVWLPGRWRRALLAPALAYGMPYIRVAQGGDPDASPVAGDAAWCCSRPRPGRAMLLEAHTLQALDATLAGATLREVAEALVGEPAVAADWHTDSALRARVRRLAQRGTVLMCGGYRRLLQHAAVAQGRLHHRAKRP